MPKSDRGSSEGQLGGGRSLSMCPLRGFEESTGQDREGGGRVEECRLRWCWQCARLAGSRGSSPEPHADSCKEQTAPKPP